MMNRRQFAGAATAALLWPAGRVSAAGAEELAGLGIREASVLLRSRRLSPVLLVEACLERISRVDPLLNSFITVTAEEALVQARDCEAELRRGRPRGPLHGVPLALKDNIDTAGIRTTAAAAALAGRVPEADAEVVRRLRAAGAILLGKLNMDECAYGLASSTSHFGAVRNPWNPAHVPGGSSGGPAAAVAARLCLGALGTDTGGSIRQPAAWCGITGLKPSYGLVSTRGVLPLSWSLDHVGPMCRSADDAALLLGAIAGHDPADPGSRALPPADYGSLRTGSLRGLRLARLAGFFDGLDPGVGEAMEGALTELRAITGTASGALRELALPPLPRLSLIFVESASWLGPLLEQHPEGFSPGVRELAATGQRITATRYAEDRRALDLARQGATMLFDDADLLVTPTTPDLPGTLAASQEPVESLGPPLSARNTTPFNVLGLPAVSVPCGFSSAGLPVGLQIIGPPGGDAAVLALARAFETRTGWHLARADV